jgi:hypothetical protein
MPRHPEEESGAGEPGRKKPRFPSKPEIHPRAKFRVKRVKRSNLPEAKRRRRLANRQKNPPVVIVPGTKPPPGGGAVASPLNTEGGVKRRLGKMFKR